ncbi:34549_t:CDS:1, partial [Gigaspora margarita]
MFLVEFAEELAFSRKDIIYLRITTKFKVSQHNMTQQENSRKNATTACTECAKSKRRCVTDSSPICVECKKKNKKCIPQCPKKRGPKPNKVTKKRVPKSIKVLLNNISLIEENGKKYMKVELTQ